MQEALNLAKTLQSQGKYVMAVAELDRATQLNPDLSFNVQLHISRGLNHFRAGLFPEALVDFERAETLDDKLPMAVYNKGNVLVKLGRDQDALKAFTKATELAPRLVEGGWLGRQPAGVDAVPQDMRPRRARCKRWASRRGRWPR
jgi:tetratricopeptide (TPR) repeat protein